MKGEEACNATASILNRELEEDFVEVWKISWHLRRLLPKASDDEIRDSGAVVLTNLTDSGAILGDLLEDGAFVPRSGNASDLIAELLASWRDLGRDPNMGELGWLVKNPSV